MERQAQTDRKERGEGKEMNEQFISLLSVALGAILTGNVVFSQLLGAGPFLSGSGSIRTAAGMGLTLTLVMGLTSAACWPINEYLLAPNGLKFIEIAVFLLTAYFLVQVLELLAKKFAPARKLLPGDGLSLAANCAVLGVVLQNVQNGSGFLLSLTYGVTGGLGFLLAIVIFASIRERLAFAECPRSFEGVPIALVSAGLVALCFTGFANLSLFG